MSNIPEGGYSLIRPLNPGAAKGIGLKIGEAGAVPANEVTTGKIGEENFDSDIIGKVRTTTKDSYGHSVITLPITVKGTAPKK